MNREISAFVITYNDRDSIAKVIEGLSTVLKQVANRHEIVIVLYDGSTDGTADVVRSYIEKDSCIRLVCQPKEQKGYGAALKLGISSSRYGLVFYTDGDNQYDVRELKLLLDALQNADIVNGNRVKRQDPIMRLIAAAVYNRLINILFPTGVKDVDSAFKLYRREVLDKIDIICDTGLADAEILAKARRLGARIAEVPISHFQRRAGKPVFVVSALGRLGLVHPSVVYHLIREMIILRKSLNIGKRLIR